MRKGILLLSLLSIILFCLYRYSSVKEGLGQNVADTSNCLLKVECDPCDSDGMTECHKTWIGIEDKYNNKCKNMNLKASTFKRKCKSLYYKSPVDYNEYKKNANEDIITPDILVNFIEKVSDELSDALTSETLYKKIKTFASKVVNYTEQQNQVQKSKSFITKDDNPDTTVINNGVPTKTLLQVLDNPILVNNKNIDIMPISYEYMKKETKNQPQWYDSVWSYYKK